jgi:hypothetical protein
LNVIKLSRSLICLAVLVLTGTSAIAQQPSLSDIAKQEEQRRQSVTEPSKVYTDADLRPVVADVAPSGGASSASSTCQSENRPADKFGNSYVIQHCSDGTTNELGSNSRTGSKWLNKYWPDGSSAGIDSCGNRWTYDAKTTVYANDNGEMRVGEGEFRRRLEEPTSCKTKASKSDQEKMRERAMISFSSRLVATRKLADDAESNHQRYMSGCYRKTTQPAVPDGVPLDSIVIGGTDALVAQGKLLPPGFGPSGIDMETTAMCRGLLSDIDLASAKVERELTAIEDDARRQGIYPGVMRELFGQYLFAR